jgi:transcriptional regulator with XRE-family HTH domain
MSAFEGLGKALRWIRDKQAKKQYQVADIAGVTKAMLSAYETGKQKPSLDTLEKILDALQVDLASLFDALEVVNERPAQGRWTERRSVAGRGSGGLAEVDVYQILGIERPLPPLEEEAMTEMLLGFHKLLRHYHQTLATSVRVQVLREEKPAET